MKAPSSQFTVGRSVSLAGAAVVLLLPALYVGPSLPVIRVDETTVVLVRYLLTTWVLPAAVSLIVGGYLLQPMQRRLPRTRLFLPTRIGVAAVLWGLGMLCLLAPILVALMQGIRLIEGGGSLPPWERTVLDAYVLHVAFVPAGILLLLSARKWVIETGIEG